MNFLTSLCKILRFLIIYFKNLFMKFTAFILLLLTSIFLIACSANQVNKKISNSELENLAKQYGGVYIFNQKFVDEIERREAERKELRKNTKGKDLGGGLYAVNTKLVDEKFPQTLSNGKKYYTRWIDYERDTGKKAEVPEIYINKIKEFMGDDFLKEEPRIYPKYMYFDGKEMRIIKIYLSYTYIETKYGLFGDEGRGVSFTKESFGTKSGDNIFYLINNKFIKANKDK
ncbi:tRNA 2-selenouridine synthase [Campylobacter concisus]|uniref:tRNA 2-selenouridine synthase n=3 Tax=Campylobacter concisus TaxID=199 RepID=UPI001CB6D47E|nr:tRNA 2-selenouridine synthase [Campylobacter concisus]